MRILVTGAGGYIGRHLVPKLREEGHWVCEVHHGLPLFPELRRIAMDLADQVHWKALSEAGKLPQVNTVIHLAGRVEISLLPNPKDPNLPPVPGPCDIGALYRDNVLATANVLDYCLKAGVKHLIFASTQAICGMPALRNNTGTLTEHSRPDPLEHYALSKDQAEGLLKMGAGQGLSVTSLRLPGVYGGDRRSGLIATWLKQALTEGRVCGQFQYPLPINVMHIADVVDAFLKAVERPASGWRALNMSDGQRSSLSHLASSVACLVPGCSVKVSGVRQPSLTVPASRAKVELKWESKPRKERLAQLLEEIRNGT